MSEPRAEGQHDPSRADLGLLLTHGNPKVVVVGGGYVGIPIAVAAARAHCDVVVLEVDESKAEKIRNGESYIRDVPSSELVALTRGGRLSATTDPSEAYEGAHVALICVPTPLRKTHEPDVSYVMEALAAMVPHLPTPVLISLESTVYPGFTREVMVPRLEAGGRCVGSDLFVAFSPERTDPGNERYQIRNTPKVVSGFTPDCGEIAEAFYSRLVDRVVRVTSTDSAEMVKILENTFRAVNIALVNEVAIMSHRLGVDVWEVIAAAATKPFGFMPFYPGPGIGGHCIPIDPYYLSWKMRSLRHEARFISLAGQVNTSMPAFVVERLTDELNMKERSVKGSEILIVGVSYKPDIDDVRESPALDVIELLLQRGANVSYVDTFVSVVEHGGSRLESLPREVDVSGFDAAVIVTHHSNFDYQRLVETCPLVFDTRNVTRGLKPGEGTKVVVL